MMDVSKQVASVVALRKLGYDVQAKGTGAVVTGLAENAPAAGHLGEGDAVVAVRTDAPEATDKPIATMEDLVSSLSSSKPGEVVHLTVEKDRSGTKEQRDVTLGARPEAPERGFLGVTLTTRDLNFEFPFDVSIDSGNVGGPSAGLAFTLGVVDVLTPGSLTGGQKIATTGTIDLNGHVGPVGGVKQKTFAVRAEGATLFLVPKDEYEEASKYAGDDLKVVGVDTLDEALDVLSRNGGDTRSVNEKASGNTTPR